jgi:putative hydrolases of HD superfamily
VPSGNDRLALQIAFLVEADKLKKVLRQTPLVDSSRQENSAEHSWHLVLVAMVMREYGPKNLDWMRVLEMVAVHDLVEIDAGDTFAYDVEGYDTKVARELAGAARVFGLLPADQRQAFRALWEEFEAHQTPEARFANAVDRLQPLLLNSNCGGGSWRTHSLDRAQVLGRMAPIETAMPDVWPHVVEVVEAFCASGLIRR